MQDEIRLIDKPPGWTSFDVVAKIRGKIRAEYAARGEKATKKQLRVGHAGTLDPFATGLLIVLLGEACKRAGEFLKLDKVYEATIRLGQVSTSGDPEGDISEVRGTSHEIRREVVAEVLRKFVGLIEQRPPMFSAIKINGQRAYKLARKGEVVEIPKRTVTIYSLELLNYSYPEIKVRAHVSSGTYIRSLAIDIGEALGTGAYCRELRRISIGKWSLTEARKLDDFVADQVTLLSLTED